jgi:hypothetical protein
MIRNCVFTGLIAKTKYKVQKSSHNWCNSVPCNLDYSIFRQGKELNKDEIRLIEIFWILELQELTGCSLNGEHDLKSEQKALQSKNSAKLSSYISKRPKISGKKKQQIELSYTQKEINEVESQIEKYFEEKMKFWD